MVELKVSLFTILVLKANFTKQFVAIMHKPPRVTGLLNINKPMRTQMMHQDNGDSYGT